MLFPHQPQPIIARRYGLCWNVVEKRGAAENAALALMVWLMNVRLLIFGN